MADFRRWIFALAVLALFAGLASAQTGGSGTSAPSCSANTSNTPNLRAEGITEQIGDIQIVCTGGNLPDGTAGTLVNITVTLTSQVTSRLLPNGASEATLMIDDPTTGAGSGPVSGYGSNAPFIDCPNVGPLAPAGCAAYGYHVTGMAGNAYIVQNATQTSPGGTATPAPNVYQGIVNSNQVTFFGVPIVPPGTNGQRLYRITNVRVNANAIGGTGSTPVSASISTSNPGALPISNPTPIVGFVSPSLTTTSNSLSGFVQCVGQALSFSSSAGGYVTFTEAGTFASAFKTRVDPAVSGQNGSPTPGQGASLLQNVPGGQYNSESGFTSTVNGYTVGLADFGTRFQAVVNNIPAGARVFVSLNNVLVSHSSTGGTTFTPVPTPSNVAPTPGVPQTPFAEAVTSSAAAEGSFGTPSTTSFIGSVPVVEVTPSSGTSATAVWEVITTNPTSIDSYSFGIFVQYTANPGTNSPGAGTATVNLSYSPTSTTTTASSGPIPRFIDTSKAANIFSIGICRTVLLFPFVTNQAGFDTGLAISNTSTDPFGTVPQAGTCQMNWYGAAAPTTPATPTIATATTYATLASGIAPGFQGYMIAVCNFQFAHGFAFISDVGARNLAMGYLALVIPDPSVTGTRNAVPFPTYNGTVTGEQLGY